jgi:hypothetical protein
MDVNKAKGRVAARGIERKRDREREKERKEYTN